MIARGDIVRLRGARRGRGHEQRGARYGVVVQSEEFQLLSTAVVVPTSRSIRPASYRPSIRIGDSETRIHTESIRAVDQSLLGEPVGRVLPQEMEEIDDALRLILDLPRG